MHVAIMGIYIATCVMIVVINLIGVINENRHNKDSNKDNNEDD